jgi:hypothetical protein
MELGAAAGIDWRGSIRLHESFAEHINSMPQNQA